jgi:hypothetical protein
LADEFDISRERVRQIEVRAFERVQKAVKTRLAVPTRLCSTSRAASGRAWITEPGM